ncbi:MAG: sugar ABC transporter substrate-binding protein, partial [Lachnospiraceae bacterium]|nr:sugar ABC transporter substrate-binding protein [Lachnospiraceae bacterium]
MSFKKRVLAVVLVGATALGTLGVARLGLPISEKKTLAEEETELSEALHLSGQKDTLYFWYTDEGMTDYLNSVAVSYNETKDDVRVVPVLKSGSEYLEHVNQASIDDEELPDIYLIGNDSLEKAYLAGLADQIQPAFATPVEELYPQAALDA